MTIPSPGEIVASLYGAWRLAHLDRRGLDHFDASIEGVWRSFFAAVIVAPLYAFVLLLQYRMAVEPPDPIRMALAEGIGYVISWVAYPVAMVTWTRLLDCSERFPLYLVAYNWSLVLQNAMLLPISLLVGAGWLPGGIGLLLWTTAIALILVYFWFIARSALDISPFTAVGIVVFDIVLSLLISEITNGLY
jgi:hypothetical protein